MDSTLKLIKELIPAVKEVSKMYGIVDRRTPAKINNVLGYLVWDYIIYNEITFEDMNGNQFSFFTSISDEKTEREWDRLVKKYGI